MYICNYIYVHIYIYIYVCILDEHTHIFEHSNMLEREHLEHVRTPGSGAARHSGAARGLEWRRLIHRWLLRCHVSDIPNWGVELN